jgi:hypothetical protein
MSAGFSRTRKARATTASSRFVFGNGDGGLCVISDYSVDLQDVLQPVLDEIAAITDNGMSFTACSEFQALTEIVRERVFGDSTPESEQRIIDLCRAARERFGIERKEA